MSSSSSFPSSRDSDLGITEPDFFLYVATEMKEKIH
jgi:hypothetical protein